MVVTELVESFITWLHKVTAPALPERSPEFLKVYTATPSEQKRFDLLQFKRDTVTAARNEIISALGYPSTDESQIFAILMKYAEQLERGIIQLTKGE